jgi:hypothetical protein
MLTILSAIFGFFGPFIPELLKFFKVKEDNKQELAILELQAKMAEANHLYKMDEINANADITEMQTTRLPQQSFGVQILDAAKDWPKMFILPVFYLFALLDFLSGFVRPAVTYAVVGFYLVYKWALFEQAKMVTGAWQVAATTIWVENDFSILLLCIGWYFGHRSVKSTFGGSANTGKAGGG